MVLFAIMIWPTCLVSVKVQVTVSLAARVMEAVAVPGPATGGAVVVKVLVPRLDAQLCPVKTTSARPGWVAGSRVAARVGRCGAWGSVRVTLAELPPGVLPRNLVA